MNEETGYDWRKSLNAAAKDLAHSLIGVVGGAAAVYLSAPENWASVASAFPAQYALPVGLATSAAAAFFRNWLKNQGR